MRSTVIRMADAIAHRGPDDRGDWTNQELGVALAHRRLAVVDLSPQGHQPMVSASGRYVVVFNGEIYNFRDIRAQLAAVGMSPAWKGESDTEVLLAAFDAWGIERSLAATNGMFALAIVDLRERTLVLARDRMGEKPIYYGWQGNAFLFGSELKALLAHGNFNRNLDPDSVGLYFRFGYVPTPRSIYRGISKLRPGHFLTVSLDQDRSIEISEALYWQLPIPAPVAGRSDGALIDELESVLQDAVRIRMHSDVPLGAFLSGGIDSSTVVALMQVQASRPVRTFSIGFREGDHDESMHARAVAGILGTDHTELTVTQDDALSVVPALPQIYDEPFADSSQIPTFLLARLTRSHVTVSISGDGGDELFGGYHRYFQGRKLLSFYRAVPRPVRSLMAQALQAIPSAMVDTLLRAAPRRAAVLLGGDRLGKLAEVMAMRDVQQLYKRLVSQWPNPAALCPGFHEPPTLVDDMDVLKSMKSEISWMMHIDQQTYLPDDILVKVDRATMAVALEARVPFLDHRLVEFAAQLPDDVKVRGSTGKWLLRQVLYRHLDKRLFERPKQGFGIPLAQWLRGGLRPWAESLLSREALDATGYLDADLIRDAWGAHLSGRQNLHYPLWVVLMFQAWCSEYGIVASGK